MPKSRQQLVRRWEMRDENVFTHLKQAQLPKKTALLTINWINFYHNLGLKTLLNKLNYSFASGSVYSCFLVGWH